MDNYNSYIRLGDNKLFGYLERKYTKFNTGGKIERSLNGTAHIDKGVSKRKWSFSFETDSRGRDRLENIWDIIGVVSLIDWNGASFNTFITSDFSPTYLGSDQFSLNFDMEEI